MARDSANTADVEKFLAAVDTLARTLAAQAKLAPELIEKLAAGQASVHLGPKRPSVERVAVALLQGIACLRAGLDTGDAVQAAHGGLAIALGLAEACGGISGKHQASLTSVHVEIMAVVRMAAKAHRSAGAYVTNARNAADWEPIRKASQAHAQAIMAASGQPCRKGTVAKQIVNELAGGTLPGVGAHSVAQRTVENWISPFFPRRKNESR